MWYSRRTALFLTAAFVVAAGCKKNDAGPAGPAVATGEPQKNPSGDSGGVAAEEPEETVDLTDYLIRGTIRVPKGSTIRRQNETVVISHGPQFQLHLAKTTRSIAEAKAAMQPRVVSWIKEIGGLLVAEVRHEKGSSFEFEGRAVIGGETYLMGNGPGQFARADVERMAQAAESISNAENAAASLAAERTAWATLTKAGCQISDGVEGRKLVLTGDRVTDTDLQVVKDIAGVTEVVLTNAPRLTPKGIESLTACRRILDLRLSGPGVTDALAAPLAKLSSPERIFLDETAVSDLGLHFLAGYTNLQVLDLSKNGPGSRGAELNGSGFGSLKGAQKLELLAVKGQPLTDECVEHLTKLKGLKRLVLTDTRITDNGVRLLEGHPGLREVEITRSPLRGGCLANLAELPALTRLAFNGVSFNDTALDRLRGTHLTELVLQNTPVGDRAAAAIGEITGLTRLDLSGTKFTDAGMPHVGRLEHLADLRLARTDLAGAGLAHLKARPALQVLDLTDTLVTDAALADLNGCPNLKTLRLGHTAITDAGLAHLNDHKSLSEIVLTGSDVTRAGVEKFRAAKPTAKIEWTEPVALADPKPAPPPVPLEKLPPADPSAVVEKYGGQVRHEDNDKAKPVVGLTLAGSAVTDADLAHLRAWKDLQTLNLSDCKGVTDAGLAYLAALPELAELYLAGSGVHGDGLVHLKAAPNLRALDLRKTGVTVKQLAALANLKELERFTLDPAADDRVLRFLAGFPALKEVDLKALPLTNQRLGLLQKMTGLERLSIASNDISDRGLLSLNGLKQLKELHLDSDSVSDAGLQAFAGAVGLKTLDLAGRRITDLGFQHFRECKELERVKVERTGLSDRGLVWFKEFGKLIELELRYADVSDKGLALLADLNQLELIDLTGCPVTDEGLKSFQGLEELRRLILDRTRVTGRGFKAIAKLPRLSRVRMTGCPLTESGLENLSLLEPLEQLGLDDTPITDDALGYLRVLPALKSLTLVRALKLTDKAVDKLKGCPGLTEVNLRGSGVSAPAVTELKKKDGLVVIAD